MVSHRVIMILRIAFVDLIMILRIAFVDLIMILRIAFVDLIYTQCWVSMDTVMCISSSRGRRCTVVMECTGEGG